MIKSRKLISITSNVYHFFYYYETYNVLLMTIVILLHIKTYFYLTVAQYIVSPGQPTPAFCPQ